MESMARIRVNALARSNQRPRMMQPSARTT
jgi:hypothetical protein